MNKDSKSIFKMQEAGSVPEVNQYGLTEEQMQSVRDNMSRYGLSEEEAVANKIRAIKDSETLRHNLWASLGGPYRTAAARLYNRRSTMPIYNAVSDFQDYTNRWTEGVKSNISSYNLNYKPVSFNPNDRIKDWGLINTDKLPQTLKFFNFKTTDSPIESEQNDINTTEQRDQLPIQRSTLYVNTPKFEIKARERAKINAEREHNEAVEQYRKQTSVDIPEWFSLLWKTAPRKNTIGGFSMPQENEEINPIAKRFLSKLYTDHAERVYEQKYNEYLNQHPIKVGTGIGYDPYIGIQYNPLVQRQGAAHNYAVKQSGYDGSHSIVPYIETDDKFGNVAIAAASMIPLMGTSFGIFGTIPKILSDIKFGYDGTKSLLSPEGLQKTFNFIKQGRYGRALASGAWDLIDFGLAKQGIKGIKSFGNYAKDIADVAKFNIWNRPNKFRMEYPWQRAQEVLPDIVQTNTGTKPTFNTLIPINQFAPAYRSGGILKKQMGGLVYKPFFPEEYVQPQDVETISYEPDDISEESFQVEPVRIYSQRVTRKPIISEEEPVTQEVETQVDNTRVEKPVTEGKIYKSAEKEQFKEDLYNAYLKALEENLEALKKKGMKEKDIEEFAKKLATQDILESNWGQSSLSKNFNFGGIKDFSGKGTVKDTTEVIDGKAVRVKQPFRKFEDIDEYVNYKIDLVDRKWNVFSTDPSKYYTLIVSGKQKYATDPNYTSKLNNLYKRIWK